MALSLRLLGGYSVHDAAGAALSLPTRKTWALLGYLAVNADRPQSRERLTALLWGDRSQRQARKSLTHALLSIRKLDTIGGSPLLDSGGEQVTLRSDAIDIDVARFRALLAERPTEAVVLYEGPFLDGLAIPDPAIEAWLVATRAELHDLTYDAQQRAANAAAANGDIDGAIRAAKRLLWLDPIREAGHQLLMRLLYEDGDRASALLQYQACADILRKELDVEPGLTTRLLHDAILQDEHSNTDDKEQLQTLELTPLQLVPVMPSKFKRSTQRHVIATLASALIVIGITVFPWQPPWTQPAETVAPIDGTASLSDKPASVPVIPRSFVNAGERDAWYAGAKQTVEQIYDRRLASQKSDWDAFGCNEFTTRTGRLECKDIAFEIQLLEQGKTKELDALKQAHELAVVSPSNHIANGAQAANDYHDLDATDPADAARVSTNLAVTPTSEPVPPHRAVENPAPLDETIYSEVKRDYAERPEETKAPAEVVRAPIPRRKPSPPERMVRVKVAAMPVVPGEPVNATTDRRDQTAVAKSKLKSKPASDRVQVVTSPVLPESSAIDQGIDRNAIELAISDYYFLNGYSGDMWSNMPVHRVSRFSLLAVRKINAEQLSVLAKYRLKGNGNGAADLWLKSRFVLRKHAGSFTVIQRRDAKPQNAGGIAIASAVDFKKDRDLIEQAINDYYFISGYDRDFPKRSIHGAYGDEIRSMSLHKMKGNHIQVDASYVAVKVSDNTQCACKGRFTLRKINNRYRVVEMRSPDRGATPPSDMKINFKKERDAVAQAISDYYFIGGYSNDIPDSAYDSVHGMEISRISSLTVQKIYSRRIEVMAEYVATSGSNHGSASMKRKSRFLLRKENGSFRVIKMWDAREA
jgi:DNA-binding SARP family transcriptional activator